MRLLLFSDLHNDLAACRQLAERARNVDVLVGAGDFCNAHGGLRKSLEPFRSLDTPTVFVAGNNETTEELLDMCGEWKHVCILHGTGTTILGVPFFGVGGGIPITPFGSWSYDFDEAEAELLLKDCPPSCVLVCHSPPHGILDRSSNGRSLGSTSILRTLERVQPKLVVCGHIHGSGGQSTAHGTTHVVNAGPSGIEWELGR